MVLPNAVIIKFHFTQLSSGKFLKFKIQKLDGLKIYYPFIIFHSFQANIGVGEIFPAKNSNI